MDLRASLMKALIVHAGVPTKGSCTKEKRCTRYTTDHFHFEGHGRVQLDRVLRYDESDFELFLYYGQINNKKEEFVIRLPLKISLSVVAVHPFTPLLRRRKGHHGVLRLPRRHQQRQRAV